MKRTLNINYLANETIVIEDTKDFKESAFSPVYQKAKDNILTIIERNEEEYYRTKDNSLEETVENIVAFVGRRGTGKTSVMRSVAEALRNSHKNDFLYDETINLNCSFIISDYIDASSLEEGDDVLEMVLASMFSKLSEFDNRIGGAEYENRELYRLFGEVYKTRLELKQDGRNTGGSPIQILAQVSNSHTLRKKIAELVKKYLKYMDHQDEHTYCRQKRFLVICIDDLDMRFDGKEETSYYLLESLHRYLMLPGVILLLAYNYKDLLTGCMTHFLRKDYTCPIQNSDISKPSSEEKLAVQYLNKVIPIYSRITMPSLRKMDYLEDNAVNVSIDKNEAKKIMGDLVNCFWDGSKRKSIEVSAKKFVLLMRAGTAELYYDAIGIKRHFTEPKSMRELAQTYTFMKYLNTLKNDENVMFKELLDDLYFRYAYEVLSEKELEKLNAFLEVPIGRRSQDIVKDIRKLYSNKWKTDISKITYVNKSRFSYSYGELLYCLYVASSKGLYSKELIWCILDSYTIMLTKLHNRLKRTKDKADTKKYKERLDEIMSDSLASSWSNLYLPKVHDLKNEEQKRLLEHDYIIFADAAIALGAVRLEGKSISFKFDLEDCTADKEADLEIILQTIEILLMFFTGIHKSGIKFKYLPPEKIENMEDKIESPKFQIEISADCFNIMNFIRNTFEGQDFFQQFQDDLVAEFRKYYQGDKNGEEFVKEKSLSRHEWYEITHRFAMPVYSFDMMYNLFKRLYANQRHIPAEVNISKLWEYVRLIYKDIGNLLKEEDEYYFSITDDGQGCRKYKFFNEYNRCPFIEYFNEMYVLDKNGEELENIIKKRKLFENNFSNMLLHIYNNSK